MIRGKGRRIEEWIENWIRSALRDNSAMVLLEITSPQRPFR